MYKKEQNQEYVFVYAYINIKKCLRIHKREESRVGTRQMVDKHEETLCTSQYFTFLFLNYVNKLPFQKNKLKNVNP